MRNVNLNLATLFVVVTTGSSHAALVISTDATQNVSCNAGVCNATAKEAVLNVTDLANLLIVSSVKVKSGRKARDITVEAPFSWTSSKALTLDAYHSIRVEEPVADSGPGALTLTTNNQGTDGALYFFGNGKVSFLSTSNHIAINGHAYTLESTLPALAAAIAANPSGFYALANNYDASADGTYSAAPIATTFTGSFNGLGNAISNMTISGGRFARLGLFFTIDTNGTVSSLNLTHINISGGNGTEAGALALSNKGLVFNNHADGTAHGISKYEPCAIGGLVAVNFGTINSSSAAVDVNIKAVGQGRGSEAGGLVANAASGAIRNSFATGNIVTQGNGASGGLAGSDGGIIITNSYARGSVAGNLYVGGYLGLNQGGTISASYSVGGIEGGGGFLGGFISGAITNSYWNTQTSGQDEGTGNGNVDGLTGLTTKQFKSGLPAGFDPAVWAQSPTINNGYPYLIDNPPPQ